MVVVGTIVVELVVQWCLVLELLELVVHGWVVVVVELLVQGWVLVEVLEELELEVGWVLVELVNVLEEVEVLELEVVDDDVDELVELAELEVLEVVEVVEVLEELLDEDVVVGCVTPVEIAEVVVVVVSAF